MSMRFGTFRPACRERFRFERLGAYPPVCISLDFASVVDALRSTLKVRLRSDAAFRVTSVISFLD